MSPAVTHAINPITEPMRRTSSAPAPSGHVSTNHENGTSAVASLGQEIEGVVGTTGIQELQQTPQPSRHNAAARPESVAGGAAVGVTTGVVTQVVSGGTNRTVSPGMAAALPMSMMTPLPRIPPFTGEGQETGFIEWREHFENVASLAGWNDHWRLVHLASSLKDTAASFYRSCGGEVRNNYQSLLTALKQRFTPVRLTAVQTQLFQNQLQREKES